MTAASTPGNTRADDAANRLGDTLDWVSRGYAFFAAKLARIGDDALGENSAVDGWSRSHVVAHVALNARALRRLVHWARTGEETPMYASPQQRSEEIEAGALWSPQYLRQMVGEEQRGLVMDFEGLTAHQWEALVVTAQGRLILASEIPWLRAREVWIHGTDLRAGGDFTDFPPSFLDRLIADATAKRSASELANVHLRQSDRTPIADEVDTPGCRVIEGSTADLARWLTRRVETDVQVADGSPLPKLEPWL